MTARPLVSVLTPVHNGAKYVAECIESVRRQTWDRWEYTVLDNQSTDETARVAEQAAAGDPRILVVRAPEFVSIWANHNRGLRAIAPEAAYVKIAHADDWLYPECLERMVSVAEAHPSVGVVSSFRLEGARVLHDGLLPYTQQTMSGHEVIRRALRGPPWATGSPTSLLFRASFVRRTPDFFDESVWHSDTDAAYRLLLESDLGFVHQVLTFTRLHPGALTSFAHSANTFLPQDVRMLVRYGPMVLPAEEYRRELGRWLRAYLWYLTRQALRPSRRGDTRFHDFHQREIERLLAEVREGERDRMLLRMCRALLGPRARQAQGDGGAASALSLSRYVHTDSEGTCETKH